MNELNGVGGGHVVNWLEIWLIWLCAEVAIVARCKRAFWSKEITLTCHRLNVPSAFRASGNNFRGAVVGKFKADFAQEAFGDTETNWWIFRVNPLGKRESTEHAWEQVTVRVWSKGLALPKGCHVTMGRLDFREVNPHLERDIANPELLRLGAEGDSKWFHGDYRMYEHWQVLAWALWHFLNEVAAPSKAKKKGVLVASFKA